jgi:hypothetical protein
MNALERTLKMDMPDGREHSSGRPVASLLAWIGVLKGTDISRNY